MRAKRSNAYCTLISHGNSHKNSHILSTEYEDTWQAHTTQRKPKDSKPKEQPRIEETPQSREEGVQIVEIEDERVTKIIEKDQKEDQEKTEEEIIIIERDKKGRLKQKKKSKDSIEAEVEIEKEEETIRKVKKSLKSKKPDVGKDEIELEEIEEFDTVSDIPIHSVALNISNQINEVVPINRIAEQAPCKPNNEKANVTLNTVNAFTEEYLPIQESEMDEITSLQQDKRKATISISSMEPYSITETTIQGRTGDFPDSFKPTSFAAIPAVVQSESLVVSEILPSEAKPSNLEISIIERSGSAEVIMFLQEATTVSEITVSQNEVPTKDFVSPNTVKAEDIMLPQIGLSVYEIQEGQVEDMLESMKTVSTKPRINVTPMEPFIVEEVHAQDKSGKYYPELIVPTEVASTTIISQMQRITEEMHAPEKEGEYVPGRLPAGQTALIEVSYGGEAAMIQEQPIQESEGIFSSDRKVITYEAYPNVRLFESISVLTVDSQQQESALIIKDSNEITADMNVVQNSSILITETVATETERQYHSDGKPTSKTADMIIVPLEVGSTSNMIVHESEGVFIENIKPTAASAESSIKPEEHLRVSEVQTAHNLPDFKNDLKMVTKSGTITIQSMEAKEVQEIVVHYQENKMEDLVKPEERKVDTIYDAIKSVEIFQITSAEKEGNLKIYEKPESHYGKAVPTHSVVSLQIEETRPEDRLGEVTKDLVLSAIANIERDDLRETVVREILTVEELVAIKQDILPDVKVADIDIEEIESVRTTEVITTERETEYTKIMENEEAYACTEFDMQVVATHQEVRTESPTSECVLEDIPNKGVAQPARSLLESITVTVQEVAEKENIYSEGVQLNAKAANVEFTETRPGAVTFEIVASERENLYSPKDRTLPDFTAQPLVDAHKTAVKTETIVEHGVADINMDLPKTGKAFSYQDALDELIITETNIAETEEPKEEEVKPAQHSAEIGVEATENLTLNELVTILNRVCIFCISIDSLINI